MSPTLTGPLTAADRGRLVELAPFVRRAVALDPRGVVRLRLDAETATVLARLPFDVLVSRTVQTAPVAPPRDVVVASAQLVAWLDSAESTDTADGALAGAPPSRDADWRGGTPPSVGWRRIETVPDDVVRGLVRSGALAVQDAARREGVPGAQPRAQLADALLDATVLTVSDGTRQTEVSLRVLSALTRMGFLPRGGAAHVDLCGRWLRVVGGHGTAYAQRPGQQLSFA